MRLDDEIIEAFWYTGVCILALAIVLGIFISTSGCSTHTGSIWTLTTTEFPDGRTQTSEMLVTAPDGSEGSSSMTTTTNGVSASVAGEQNKAELADVEGATKNKGYLFIACGIFLLLGGIAIAMPDSIIGSKDAFLVMGSALASTAVVFYVDASADIMGIILPVLIVVGVGFMFWKYFVNKPDTIQASPSNLAEGEG